MFTLGLATAQAWGSSHGFVHATSMLLGVEAVAGLKVEAVAGLNDRQEAEGIESSLPVPSEGMHQHRRLDGTEKGGGDEEVVSGRWRTEDNGSGEGSGRPPDKAESGEGSGEQSTPPMLSPPSPPPPPPPPSRPPPPPPMLSPPSMPSLPAAPATSPRPGLPPPEDALYPAAYRRPPRRQPRHRSHSQRSKVVTSRVVGTWLMWAAASRPRALLRNR